MNKDKFALAFAAASAWANGNSATADASNPETFGANVAKVFNACMEGVAEEASAAEAAVEPANPAEPEAPVAAPAPDVVTAATETGETLGTVAAAPPADATVLAQ